MGDAGGSFDSPDNAARDIVVHASKRKILIWLALLAGFNFLVLVYARMPTLLPGAPHGIEPPDTPLVRTILVAGALGLVLAFAARQVSWLFASAPVLVITPQGIGLHSWLFGTGVISWSQIAAVRITTRRLVHISVLRIEVRDWQAVRAQQNNVQVLLNKLSGWALQWPRTVVINDMVMATSLQALLHEVWYRYQAEIADHGVRFPHPG